MPACKFDETVADLDMRDGIAILLATAWRGVLAAALADSIVAEVDTRRGTALVDSASLGAAFRALAIVGAATEELDSEADAESRFEVGVGTALRVLSTAATVTRREGAGEAIA